MNAIPESLIGPPPVPTPVRAPGLPGAIGLLVLYFALQMAIGFTLMFCAGLVIGLQAGLTHASLADGAIRAALSDPSLRTWVTVATLVLAAGLTLWLAHRHWPGQWRLADASRGFGLTAPTTPSFFAAALALGVAAPVLGGLLTRALAGDHPVSQSIASLGHSAPLVTRLLLALAAVTIGPLVEELMFRGVLFSALLGFRRGGERGHPGGMRIAFAMLGSALLFGMVHLPDLGWRWYAVPGLALLGVGCAWLRLRSGSLWPAVAAHGVNNLLAVAGWFIVAHPGG